jgi:hypothetical protein
VRDQQVALQRARSVLSVREPDAATDGDSMCILLARERRRGRSGMDVHHWKGLPESLFHSRLDVAVERSRFA